MVIHTRLAVLCYVASVLSNSLNPVDCSPPGSTIHGIVQARILEWVATLSSRKSYRPRGRTCLLPLLHWQAGSLPLAPAGKISFTVPIEATSHCWRRAASGLQVQAWFQELSGCGSRILAAGAPALAPGAVLTSPTSPSQGLGSPLVRCPSRCPGTPGCFSNAACSTDCLPPRQGGPWTIWQSGRADGELMVTGGFASVNTETVETWGLLFHFPAQPSGARNLDIPGTWTERGSIKHWAPERLSSWGPSLKLTLIFEILMPRWCPRLP